MISTFQALAVAAIALLPGAMYVWGFESAVGGRWGIQAADRIPRFLGYSAIFHALLSPATYLLYAYAVRGSGSLCGGSSWSPIDCGGTSS